MYGRSIFVLLYFSVSIYVFTYLCIYLFLSSYLCICVFIYLFLLILYLCIFLLFLECLTCNVSGKLFRVVACKNIFIHSRGINVSVSWYESSVVVQTPSETDVSRKLLLNKNTVFLVFLEL